MERICPEILIISDKHDYSTDHVTFQLNKMNASYLRLNRDQFVNFDISLDPLKPRIYGDTKNFSFEVSPENLKSIYFRAPIYLRDNYQPGLEINEQLKRNQWIAFIRSIMVFDDVFWMNNPQATYKAETKPYQLYTAKKIGFKVPKTIITNKVPIKSTFGKKLIVKTLDPAILSFNDKEGFIYTNFVNYEELLKKDLSSVPVILQEALIPKVDVRVTVVGNKAFGVTIKKNKRGLNKDWRLEKENIEYELVNLPPNIERKCIQLTKKLNLKFGGIDLIIHDDKYYFIEINPTGEWSWLMHHLNLDIDKEIAKLLMISEDLCQVNLKNI